MSGKVSLITTNSQNTTIAMSSDSNSPETTTISEQNTTTNETGTGKQGRKRQSRPFYQMNKRRYVYSQAD